MMKSRIILFIIGVSALLGQNPTTLTWVDTSAANYEIEGYFYDKFFQYYVPDHEGYVESIDFNLADIPDIPNLQTGLAVRVFSVNYTNWSEIPTHEIADTCFAANLGYYDEPTGWEVIGNNWIQGGINSLSGANPDFNYDPIGEQIWPPNDSVFIPLPTGVVNSGLFTINLSEHAPPFTITPDIPFAVVVNIVVSEEVDASIEEMRFAFFGDTLHYSPQPCLKFYGTFSSPNGRCGSDDWGWYIRSCVLDWRVNAIYTTGIDQNLISPERFKMKVQPNPLNPSTLIKYSLPQGCDLKFIIYDLSGKQIWQREMKSQTPGNHYINWNGTDSWGQRVDSGIYIIRLSSDSWSQSQKISVVK